MVHLGEHAARGCRSALAACCARMWRGADCVDDCRPGLPHAAAPSHGKQAAARATHVSVTTTMSAVARMRLLRSRGDCSAYAMYVSAPATTSSAISGLVNWQGVAHRGEGALCRSVLLLPAALWRHMRGWAGCAASARCPRALHRTRVLLRCASARRRSASSTCATAAQPPSRALTDARPACTHPTRAHLQQELDDLGALLWRRQTVQPVPRLQIIGLRGPRSGVWRQPPVEWYAPAARVCACTCDCMGVHLATRGSDT